MNFDVSKAKVTPFSLPEQEVGNRFLTFIIEGDNTPLDVAQEAKITQVKKLFYPIRCFTVGYTAQWSATSVWEHKEKYTVSETKTIYIDYKGEEHDRPGFDHLDRRGREVASISSDAIRRSWTPQQKVIQVPKTRTVVDNKERTQGDIGDHCTFQPIITYLKADESFAQWVGGFLKEGDYKSYQESLVAGSEVQDLIETDAFARDQARANASSLARSCCRREVPGNRFEEFSCDVYLDQDCPMEVVLIPIYRITYTYQDDEYVCWLGGKANSNFFYARKPQDETLAAEKERLNTEVSAQKKTRLKSGAIAFLLPPIGLFFGLIYMIVDRTKGLLLIGGSVAVAVLFGRKFLTAHHSVRDQTQAIENRTATLREKREKISNIVRDSTMSEAEKRQAVAALLKKPTDPQ